MTPFQTIYEEALFRQGDETTLKAKLPLPKSKQELLEQEDSVYLSIMSRRIFRAGLKHSMVDAKWPAFEGVFHGFNVRKVSMMSDEALEKLLQDSRIIRHWGKIKAVRANAQAINELQKDYKSVGEYLANWSTDKIVLLWDDLKERFTQLGGNSGPYFLRMSGKDTFLLTPYVIRALLKWNAIDKEPKGKKARQLVQDVFNQWSEQAKRPLCQISMILALSID